jgi:hypothetical protein
VNGWALVIFAALAVAVGAAYLAGKVAGIGRGEQDRGDLAEQLTAELGRIRHLEQRCADQSARIRALTDWEMIDHATHTVPGVLRALPVPRTAADQDAGRVHRRPDRRPREATRTLAFLAVAPLAPVGEPLPDEPGPDPAATSWDEWPVIMAQIAEGHEWVASL